jgi:ATP:ADP antiporter, AAA family
MIELFKRLTKDQKSFLILALGFSFLITLDYSCLRPAAQSLFITKIGAKYLPWVWLAGLPINFLIVALFNKIQSWIGSKTLSLFFPPIVLAINLILTLLLSKFSFICVLLYIWKDLYILLMFQQLWSQIHASMGHSVGKAFYGLMYGFGALGSLCGSSIPAFFKLETGHYLFCTLFIYPFIWIVQSFLNKSPIHAPLEKKKAPRAIDGFKQIVSNKDLITIGLLVAFMQMISALSEYNFSFHLERKFSDLATRTQASAATMSILHLTTLSLQLIVSCVSIEKLGINRGHRFIPLLISMTSLVYLVVPSFKTASFGYIGTKSLDFSLFSVLKESLYAPLDKIYKYEAKSFIDIFVYRGAKTLMSLGLIVFGFLHSSLFFGILLFALATIWFLVVKSRLQPQSSS